MRRASLLLLVVAFAAGCGGGKQAATEPVTTAPPVTTRPADPGRDAIEAFVAAARQGQPDTLWGMLSTSARERLGPSLSRFRSHTAGPLIGQLAGFQRFRTIVSERVTPELGVVAIDGSRLVRGGRARSVYAAALRLEGTQWKFELGGPVIVRPIGPDPGARETVVAQVAAAVEGPGGTGTALMYVDGQTQTNLQSRGTSSNATLFANFEPALDPGRHTVVVFASDGREASATAWAFTVAKKA